jgi:hypothetical protein
MVLKTSLGVTEANWVNQQPSDLDYLKPNGFKFQIHNLPNVSYFCQAANIPAIQLGSPTFQTPLSDIPVPVIASLYDQAIQFSNYSSVTCVSPYIIMVQTGETVGKFGKSRFP